MSKIEIDGEISRLFDAFVEAFGTFDGKVVADLFIAPGVALKRDGTLQGFVSHQDVQTYYQAALDHYHASGCRTCRYFDLETRSLNDNSVIATASWDLVHEDGSVISHWRQAHFFHCSARRRVAHLWLCLRLGVRPVYSGRDQTL